MKDYAKLVQNPGQATVPQSQTKSKESLVRSAKEMQPKEQRRAGNLLGMLLLIFIVLVVAYGIIRQYLQHHHLLGLNTAVKDSQSKAASNADSAGPQFDFYTVLPKGNIAGTNASANTNNPLSTPVASVSSVAASTASISAVNASSSGVTPTATPANMQTAGNAPIVTMPVAGSTSATNPAAASTPAANTKFYLNVGDYATAADAEQMLSQLLLLGVEATVAPKEDNGATAYEVMVGPFNDAAAMNVVKSQLAAHEINALVVQAN